jgi:CRP/FNR family transcriptional regulator, cyclic AMP receptor protein
VPVTSAELGSVPLFTSCGESDLIEIARWFEEANVSEGVKVAGEGAPGYSFFVIAEGTAVVTQDGQELRTLGPGDFFGEVALLDGGKRTASVLTTAPSRLLVLFGTEFRKLQDARPDVALLLEAAVAERT